jgi:hypothetical protein
VHGTFATYVRTSYRGLEDAPVRPGMPYADLLQKLTLLESFVEAPLFFEMRAHARKITPRHDFRGLLDRVRADGHMGVVVASGTEALEDEEGLRARATQCLRCWQRRPAPPCRCHAGGRTPGVAAAACAQGCGELPPAGARFFLCGHVRGDGERACRKCAQADTCYFSMTCRTSPFLGSLARLPVEPLPSKGLNFFVRVCAGGGGDGGGGSGGGSGGAQGPIPPFFMPRWSLPSPSPIGGAPDGGAAALRAAARCAPVEAPGPRLARRPAAAVTSRVASADGGFSASPCSEEKSALTPDAAADAAGKVKALLLAAITREKEEEGNGAGGWDACERLLLTEWQVGAGSDSITTVCYSATVGDAAGGGGGANLAALLDAAAGGSPPPPPRLALPLRLSPSRQ